MIEGTGRTYREALYMSVTKKEAVEKYPDWEIIASPQLPYKPWFWERIDEHGDFPVLIRKVVE